jgi:hydroxyacylglutathione hydrolase
MSLLLPIPAFSDNYIWLFAQDGEAWVVDPGEAPPVLEALKSLELTLAGILVTHHHGDHTGGIKALRENFPVPVFGPENSPAAELINNPLSHGESIKIGTCQFLVISIPGHTLDHIAYYSAAEKILFCGDTLFSAGCGRVFEGTYEQMYQSLLKLAALPDDTRVCCAHEYTLSNLRFAIATEPSNRDIVKYKELCDDLREKELPTLPTSIGLEKRINPFLRCKDLAYFSERRELKNNF